MPFRFPAAVHMETQRRVDAGLVTPPMGIEELEDVSVQPGRDRLFPARRGDPRDEFIELTLIWTQFRHFSFDFVPEDFAPVGAVLTPPEQGLAQTHGRDIRLFHFDSPVSPAIRHSPDLDMYFTLIGTRCGTLWPADILTERLFAGTPSTILMAILESIRCIEVSRSKFGVVSNAIVPDGL